MRRTLCWIPAVIALFLSGVFSAQVLAADLQMVGLRGGISDNHNDEDFKQYEVFATLNLPWSWNSGSDWQLSTYLEANAGLLNGGNDSTFVGSVGPGLCFTGLTDKISIRIGVNPTLIGRHEFGDEDLGGPFQFTSHISINLNLVRHFAIGYRFQHMSNFVFYESNPGLNLHMIEIGYSF